MAARTRFSPLLPLLLFFLFFSLFLPRLLLLFFFFFLSSSFCLYCSTASVSWKLPKTQLGRGAPHSLCGAWTPTKGNHVRGGTIGTCPLVATALSLKQKGPRTGRWTLPAFLPNLVDKQPKSESFECPTLFGWWWWQHSSLPLLPILVDAKEEKGKEEEEGGGEREER